MAGHHQTTTLRRGPTLGTSAPRPQTTPRLCLGGVGAPHSFPSCGPAHRICDRCRAVIDARRLSPLRAIPTPEGLTS